MLPVLISLYVATVPPISTPTGSSVVSFLLVSPPSRGLPSVTVPVGRDPSTTSGGFGPPAI